MIICAHRGGCGENKPENTMRAFKRAVKSGVTMIEFDVWLSSDDKLIVIHGGDNGE
jgi:glycerophosphoryl diester phosphodiesterase